jgi:hypothetical protein
MEKRICLDLVETERLNISLEWGADTGPLKLIVNVDGKAEQAQFFMEHSTTAMKEAFDRVDGYVTSYGSPT